MTFPTNSYTELSIFTRQKVHPEVRGALKDYYYIISLARIDKFNNIFAV